MRRRYWIVCLGDCYKRALLCWRFPPRRGNWTLLSSIKVLFQVLFWYCSRHILVVTTLFSKYFYSTFNITSGILQVVSELFPGHNYWGNFFFFFRVETYSGIFKLQRSVIPCINPWSGRHTWRNYKWFLSAHCWPPL